MTGRGVVLLVGLTVQSASAAPPADSPRREPELPWRRYVVPALEGATVSLGLLAFSNLVTRQPFALVTGESLVRNLSLRSWTFDVDYYLTNQFGHAYQGGLYFNAARSSGLSFWWATLYATLGSLAWELFFEAERPSINDQITTPIAGALLGEALHRAARHLRDGAQPRWLGLVGAAILDPMGALQGGLFEASAGEDEPLAPTFLRWQLGAAASVVVDRADQHTEARSTPQALVTVLLVAGAPWDPRSTYDAPLSYFDLRADLSFPSKVVGNVFIRGLLVGGRFGSPGGRLKGLGGLLGAYDFAAPAIVRASAVGLGPGFLVQLQPAEKLYVQAGGMLGASPFAAAGQLLEVSPALARDYHMGPGLQSMVDLRLIRPGWFQLELGVRNWLVWGAYTPPAGFESVTWVTLAATVPFWRWLGAGVEATLSDRRANFAGDGNTHDTGLALRLTVSVMTERHFGVGGGS